MGKRVAVIIGAGPAGLTAAFELLNRTDIKPVVLELSEYMGGISRTVNYKGNRIDIGGHRFFSKSDRVMQWWIEDVLPLEKLSADAPEIAYHNQRRALQAGAAGVDPEKQDNVMLVRNRLSRIYFMRRFFRYPITLTADTIRKLGLWRTFRIGISYLRSLVFPIRNETNLEEFFINRFGRLLYETFFKAYTEKVWGVGCTQISAQWGAQRIKGLSIYKTLLHIAQKLLPKRESDLSQKDTETSLIERFLYPKFGPGQMWEEVASQVVSRGGEIFTGWSVDRLDHDNAGRITAVTAVHTNGERRTFQGDYVFSTMPVRELTRALTPPAPAPIREVAEGLVYRSFITVGLLCTDLKIKDNGPGGSRRVQDNWIYIQEPDVLVGRLQIFNNWSPYMVKNPEHTWVGLEYFCNEGDELWEKNEADMIALAKAELHKIGILDPSTVLDATVIHMPKAYPAYFGSYDRFPQLIGYFETFANLFLVGRNGMHKYNNQDHSMLASMVAVDNIVAGIQSRENLWSLNTEQDYHEEAETKADVKGGTREAAVGRA